MTFGLIVIGIYVIILDLIILGIYCSVATAIIHRISKQHSKHKEDERGSDNAK